MRTFAPTLICLLLLARQSIAQGIPTPETLYQQQKKSVALAVTLEALCPIAGAGALYAGEDDKATLLAIISTVSAGAAVGSLLYLIHLDHQSPTGVDHVVNDFESGSAWTVLVSGGLIYLLTRISGLSFAPDAVGAFNTDLQQRLGVSPTEPLVPFHAQITGASQIMGASQITGVSMIWRF